MPVSVCIPTYNRPGYLEEAIKSCLSQTRLPDEILIGDDSGNNNTQNMVARLQKNSSVRIRYFKHQPALKQAANVNFLFNQVHTDFLMLLHDDDILMNDAVEKLMDISVKHPDVDAFFGKQYVMDINGVVDVKASEALNKNFYRTVGYEGSGLSPVEVGFLQQFPSNGYMLKTSVVQKVLYNEQIGDACDFDFGVRLGINNCHFYFLNQFICKYRVSEIAVSTKKSYDAGFVSYGIVKALKLPQKSEIFRAKWLELKAPVAIVQACNTGHAKEALGIYFSKWHYKKIFTLGGIKRLLLICKAALTFTV